LTDWEEIGNNLVQIAGSDWLSPNLKSRIEATEHLYVACSGGADSVFLLSYFATVRRGEDLSVLHFNHKLRGRESDEDKQFVESICSSLNIPLITGFWEREDIDSSVSEDEARTARNAFFSEYSSNKECETAILTGHHAGDVLETMLMRISRGSGLQGLTAPREVSRGPDGLIFFRPLLRLRKDKIVDFLRQVGAEWREDASNQTDAYYRNRLRSSVIPNWESVSDRPVQEGAVTARALLEDDWEALEYSFDDAWKTMILDDEYRLAWAATRTQPRAFQRRALNRLVETETGSCLALASVETILESLRTGEDFKTNVTASHWVVGNETNGIRVISDSVSFSWDELCLPDDCTMFLPDGSVLSAKRVYVDEDLFDSIRSGAHSHDSVVFIKSDEKHSSSVRVRLCLTGDAYQAMGRGSSAKLKDLLSDRKIPIEKRKQLPVVLNSSDEILWVPGLPPNLWATLTADTRQALRLTYEECPAG